MNTYFRFKSLRTRLAFWFLLVTMLCLLAVVTTLYFQRAAIIRTMEFEKLQLSRDLKVREVNNWLDERLGDLEVLANDDDIRGLEGVLDITRDTWTEEDLTAINLGKGMLQRFLGAYSGYIEVFFIEASSGRVFISTEPTREGDDNRKDAYFIEPLRTRKPFIHDVYHSKVEGKPVMAFSTPVSCSAHDGKHVIGVLTTLIDLDQNLYPLLQDRTGAGKTGETLIVNKDGFAINTLRWHESAPLTLKISAEPALRAIRGETGIIEAADYRGEMVLSAYTYFPLMKWGLVVKRDLAEAYAPIQAMLKDMVVLVLISLIVVLLVAFFLSGSISKPILGMNVIAHKIQAGDYSARNIVRSKDELGSLANAINSTADKLSLVISAQKSVVDISGLMLTEDDTRIFFQKVLQKLSGQTDSQIAAVYLLSDDQKSYDHFESIGLDTNARQSFTADNFEGEFGTVISSRKVQHIKNIPEDTRFVFHTVAGKFIPREILTIPIHANNEVIAIISLASLGIYSELSIQMIDNILNTLSARVEGLLAYDKIKEFSAVLEHQNTELEASKMELSAQSAELVEQNTELELQKQQLSQASQLKTSFLSNMSHELRTPLNSVIALSAVLYKRLANKISEEEYSYIEIIKRNGKNLLDLINDILDMARIEAGEEDLDIIKFNSTDLVDDIVSSLRLQADQKNIQLIHTKPDPNLFISSDVKKCQHILQNLISNAVKFTEKGDVEVSEKQNANGITITVRDTGIGISEDQIAYIFDEFNQADSSTSRKFGGTGLGLAIAKKYANMLGGNISVKSEVGKSSEFALTLPLLYASENKIVDSETASPFKHHGTQSSLGRVPDQPEKTLLLVDDSEPALIQMKDILEESGYHILLAHDGSEALAIIENTIPDAMILDLMMPGIDGFQVLKSIREQKSTAHLPVLILTAKHITKAELKFLKSNNVRELIQKGDVNPDELLGAVANMLFPEPEALKTIHPEPPTIKGKPVVLVVEDNPDNMLSAKAVLSDGFTVLEAVDGIEGVEMAKRFKPDLILMDIALPKMDGVEAFKKIRSDPALLHIKVIALTASAMTQDREIVLAHGFDSFIPKPIDELIFFKTINRVLYGK